MTIAQNLSEIKDRICRACEDAERDPADVTVIAVTKTRTVDQIKETIDAGIIHFGENRVKEALEKWPDLKGDHVTLHLIGPLQTNKVKQAKEIFDVLHTLDRSTLLDEMQKQGWVPPSFVQVNTGEEEQKSGLMPLELRGFMTGLASKPKGLMCIPPVNDNPSHHFAFLARLARKYELPSLSMGMSDDYEAAIRCGATHIRIGSALFA